MIKFKLFFLIILLGLILACHNDPVSFVKDYHVISLDSIRKDIKYSDVFETVRYVVLHGLPEGEAVYFFGKIFKFKEGYVCWDKEQNTIFIFDENGKYLRHIRSIGAGPKEYVDIVDLYYDDDTELIYVIDRASFLLKYNLEGEGENKIMLPKMASNVIVAPDGNPLFYSNPRERGGEMDNCILWSMKETAPEECVDREGIEINKFHLLSSFKFSKSFADSEIFFNTPLSPDIFSVSGPTLRKKYEIELGARQYLNSGNLVELSFEDQLEYMNSDRQLIYNLGHIFSPHSWIVFSLLVKHDIGLWISPHSYQPREFILFHPEAGIFSSHNMMDDDGHFFYWKIVGAYENEIIHHLYSQDVERIIEEEIELPVQNDRQILELLEPASEVLMIMELKSDLRL